MENPKFKVPRYGINISIWDNKNGEDEEFSCMSSNPQHLKDEIEKLLDYIDINFKK